MAIAKVQKFQLLTIAEHKSKILEYLQNFGTLELQELDENLELENSFKEQINELQKIDLSYANVEYSIKLLSEYGEKKGLFADPITLSFEEAQAKAKEINHKDICEKCTSAEEKLIQAKNEIAALKVNLELYKNWKSLEIKLENLEGTEKTNIVLGVLKKDFYNDFIKDLNDLGSLISIEKVHETETDSYLTVVFDKSLETKLRQKLSEFKFSETELPKEEGLLKEYCHKLEEKITKNEELIKKQEKELKGLAKNLDDLKVVYDFLTWEKEKLEEEKKIASTEYSLVLQGWIPKNKSKELEENLTKITSQFELKEIELEEGEVPPVIIKNNKFIEPFEAVTAIYGLPLYKEIDPTPFLAAYFIIFFGMCLTDAGYGLLMFIVTALALKFLKLAGGIKKLVKLLMYGGIITFVIGALFGGWFGLTPDQVPEVLTYTAENGEKLFVLQRINSLTDPLTVLILALGIGFFQILMGTFMKLVHGMKENKKEALLDTGPWAFMLTGIGFAILAAAGVLPASLIEIGKWWVISATVLIVLTQGRGKKSIVGKLVSGILSLYDLIGYLSDVLSYSRLLALGLATAIIGLAVNIIATLMIDMIPYAGYLIAAVIFIGGHIFNLLINALGSFIHSGRLQYVEFFGKFLEGGGTALKPFSKKSKYIFIKTNN
jgi:V/A-type H+/Na+-transporting ATPase subunit I